MTIKAQVTWTKGLQFVARPDGGPAVILDTPEGGSGASPMDLLLMGTAGCTAMDVISILQKKRLTVTGFTVNIAGTRTEDHPRSYTDIEIEYVVFGTDIKPAAVQQAIELSESKYCGAMASLKARISNRFRIEAA